MEEFPCFYIKSGVTLTDAEYEVLCEGRNDEHGMAVSEDAYDKFFSFVRLIETGKFAKQPRRASKDFPYDIPEILKNMVKSFCVLTLSESKYIWQGHRPKDVAGVHGSQKQT